MEKVCINMYVGENAFFNYKKIAEAISVELGIQTLTFDYSHV